VTTPPLLILTPAVVGRLDPGACAVAEVAARRGATVTVVGAVELATADWSHRICDGIATTRIRLRDGRLIDSLRVGAVLNLIAAIPAVGFDSASDRDRDYAHSEQQALFVSFLAGLGDRLIGGVDGQGPTGNWAWTRWAAIAHRCGIATAAAEHRSVANTTVTVIGERVFDAPSRPFAQQCLMFSELSGCQLLHLTITTGRHPVLRSASAFPPLMGEVPQALAELLLQCAHGRRHQSEAS
jgi:hypothetical protein